MPLQTTALAGLLCAAIVCIAEDPNPVAELETFEAERSAFRRLLPGKQGVTAESVGAYHEALLEASAGWVARWPAREFAWRARLEALAGLPRRDPESAREAVAKALESRATSNGVFYREPLELLAARVLIRHRTELEQARALAAEGLRERLCFLDRLESARGGDPDGSIGERRRVWRWTASLIAAQAAAAEGDLAAWREELERLGAAAPLRPKGDDRAGAVAYASAQLELHLQRARLALAEGRPDEALQFYQRGVSFRPKFPGKTEPPANRAALDEARAAWLAAGRRAEEWDAWAERQRGFPIPHNVQ